MRAPANPFYGQPPKGILDNVKREGDVGWAQIFRFTQDDNFSRKRFSNNLLGLVTLSELPAVQRGMGGLVCARLPILVAGHPSFGNDLCQLPPERYGCDALS